MIALGKKGGITREEHEEIKWLKRENATITVGERDFETHLSLFCTRTRPPWEHMIAFIDEYRERFLVEFICRVLGEHTIGGFIEAY
ncbi:hypothetical protein [Trueperella sp.]|uniref:hypothetical protein n=1 Tax=Trueperella sp. TaxID=2699835 RepID=UPI00261743C9|nr:hypothetical protein [Trueperella sp.]